MLVPDYQILYAMLFNTVTEAVEQMENQNFGMAKELLLRAKRDGERCCFPDAGEGPYDCFRDPALLPREKNDT